MIMLNLNPFKWVLLTVCLVLPAIGCAETTSHNLNLTTHWVGYLVLAIFVIAYTFVILEEKIHLSKVKTGTFSSRNYLDYHCLVAVTSRSRRMGRASHSL